MTTTDEKAVPGKGMAGRQTNHGDYRLPEGLPVAPTAPLYQAVALWGWRLGRPFCRDELAQAFHISVRRAGDVMSYIRRARPDRVRSHQHYTRMPSGARLRHLQIVAPPRVDGAPVAAQPVYLARPGESVTDEAADDAPGPSLSALRRWFIGGARGGGA